MEEALKRISDVCGGKNRSPGSGVFECRKCQGRFNASQLDETADRTYPGDFSPVWGGNPPEYVDVCPDCGERDSMEELTLRQLMDEEDPEEVLMIEPEAPGQCGPVVSRGILRSSRRTD